MTRNDPLHIGTYALRGAIAARSANVAPPTAP
jgi:hypothetical protein